MAITYSISGGADAAKFNINATTGVVTFKTAPDFETPGDANRDNVYEVQIKATDPGGAATTQDVRVTVTDVVETPANMPPQFSSAPSASVAENQTAAITVVATDPDAGGPTEPPIEPPPSDTKFWTVLTETSPSGEGSSFSGAGTRKIYISSSSGNDSNPGTQASPKKTVNGGKALLRAGKPDWLLFKKGDTWTGESFGNVMDLGGPSASSPMLFGAYGTGKRPLFQIATSSGNAMTWNRQTNNVAIIGLEFYAYQRDPDNPAFIAGTANNGCPGIMMNVPTTYLLIEDCKVSFFTDNVIVQGSGTQTFKMRRCVILNSYINQEAVHSQGIYTANIADQWIEECIFDGNGWNPRGGSGAVATFYNRNAYIDSEQVPIKAFNGNFTSNSSSEGMQIRPGGVIKNNFCYQNTIGMLVGKSDSGTPMADVTGNVVMRSVSTRPGFAGVGINTTAIQNASANIRDNIISERADDNNAIGHCFLLESNTAGVKVTNNIVFNWHNNIQNEGTNNTISPNAIDLAGTNTAGYPDPKRTLGSYYASIGGTNSGDAFIKAIRNQSKDSWDDRLTAKAVVNYIRAGFGLAAV